MKFNARLSDQSAALTDAFKAMNQSLSEGNLVMTRVGKDMAHLIASSVKALSREQRREYRALRKSGMYHIDALAQIEDRHS